MDIKRFDSITRAEEGVEMPLIDPITRQETDGVLILYGADSSHFKQVDKELVARAKARGRMPSAEEITDEVLERLSRMTKGWKGLQDDGKPFPFSQEKAKELYRAYPEIADRAASFIYSRANFFAMASKG